MDFLRPQLPLSQYVRFLATEEARIRKEQNYIYKIFGERIAAIKNIQIPGFSEEESRNAMLFALQKKLTICIDDKKYSHIDEYIDIDPKQIKEPCDSFDIHYGYDAAYSNPRYSSMNKDLLNHYLTTTNDEHVEFIMKFTTKIR
jgi:hypothetical protein